MTPPVNAASHGAVPDGALLIGGDRMTGSSGGTHQHIYAATGRPNGIVELAGATEMDQAVTAARHAQREWAALPVDRRRDLLIALADAVSEDLPELARLSVHDYAVPISRAGMSVLTERFLRYYAGYADKAHGVSTPISGSFDVDLVEREPYGVVAVLVPWNGPLVAIGLNAVPALAAGNAVVIKPPELAPFAALRFGELCLRAGLPPGLVNVVSSGPEGGDALVRHPGIGKVHFTGGGSTARKVLAAAAENLTPVATELGGKNAYIVFADADLDAAAYLAAAQGPIGQSGQSCACASRILVHAKVYDAFLGTFVAAVQTAEIGDPLDPAVVFGPVITQNAADRILGVIDQAVQNKAGELLTGGRRIGGDLADGFYIEPTVFADVDNRSPLAAVETFGPVVSVQRFTDDTEAVALANDTVYGLNAFVQTRDLVRAHKVARALQTGSVWINRHSDISPQGPYGGYKQSGSGRAGGLEGLQEFQQVKNIRIGIS
ncbi:aldehyde dehydrogenase family protein [Spirillospora sp. NPDC000708]